MAYFSNWRVTRTGILFIVGVLVLAGVVFGGIWIVKDRGEQARRDEAVKIAEQNLEDQSEVAINKATDAVNEGNAENTSDDLTPTFAEKAASNASNTGTVTIPTTSTVGELPATGTEFTNIIVITLLSLAVAFYVTSRKAVHER